MSFYLFFGIYRGHRGCRLRALGGKSRLLTMIAVSYTHLVNIDDVYFSRNMSVTFSIEGINDNLVEGAAGSYKAELSKGSG